MVQWPGLHVPNIGDSTHGQGIIRSYMLQLRVHVLQLRLSEAKYIHAAAAKLLQSCPTLCDPIDGGPPGSCIPGILQARTLEWVAISFSNA